MYITIIVWEGNLGHSIYDAKKYFDCESGGRPYRAYCLLFVGCRPGNLLSDSRHAISYGSICQLSFFRQSGFRLFWLGTYWNVVILISSSTGASADIDTNIVVRVFYIFLASVSMASVRMSIIAPLVNPDGGSGGALTTLLTSFIYRIWGCVMSSTFTGGELD